MLPLNLKHNLEPSSLPPEKKLKSWIEQDEEIETITPFLPDPLREQVDLIQQVLTNLVVQPIPAPIQAGRMTYEQFTQACMDLTNQPDFQERSTKFQQIFEKCLDKDGDEEWKLKIAMPGSLSAEKKEFVLELILNQGDYDSQFMHESCQLNGETPEGQTYFYLEGHPQGNRESEKDYFEMRFNRTGTAAELIHLKKSQQMSGTTSRDISCRILNFLKIKTFLNDDSYIEGANENDKMFLRFYMPIVSEIPKTLYSGLNFKIWKFDNALGIDGQPLKPQDPAVYQHAVELIRNTTLDELISLYSSFENIADLNELRSRYKFQGRPCETVHELGFVIYNLSLGKMQGVDDAAREQAKKDFKSYYKLAFFHQGIRPRTNYIQALGILDTYKYWVKE